MQALIYYANRLQDLVDAVRKLDFLGSVALRLVLAFIFIGAGFVKINNFENTAMWFGNTLGMPAPTLMAFLATAAEFGGGILILLGLAVRYVTIPLMITMVVAGWSVHAENGWYTVGQGSPSTNWARPWAELGIPAAKASLENSKEVGKRRSMARNLLREHGNYGWLTEKGSITVLQNGIETSAYYFIMLLALFFLGGGRYVSIDYWLRQKYRDHSVESLEV